MSSSNDIKYVLKISFSLLKSISSIIELVEFLSKMIISIKLSVINVE